MSEAKKGVRQERSRNIAWKKPYGILSGKLKLNSTAGQYF